jgi:hypothetical protein
MRLVLAAAAALAAALPALAQDDAQPPAIPINPAAIDELTYDQLTRCNGDDQWQAQLAPADERAAIAAAAGVKRSGQVLKVGAARFVSVHINQTTGAGVAYGYIGRYRALPLAVVSVAYFEGGAYLIVDPATGEHVDGASLPLPGPGGHILAGATRAAAYDDPGIEIVDWRDGHLKSTRIETPVPCGLHWISEDVLGFNASTDFQGKPPLHNTPATVRRENGVWVYRGPLP